MSTRELRRPLRGYVRDSRRRKMVLDLDLNDVPQGENRIVDENSTRPAFQGAQPSERGEAEAFPPAAIDVESIDDEVLISSPRTFAEARSKSKRNHDVTVLLDEDSEVCQDHRGPRLAHNSLNKRKRVPPNRTVINCELYINLEGSSDGKKKDVMKPLEPFQIAPPPPPKELTFNCPVCMGPLVEEMSTKCGHIFCKKCIKAAIVAQSKCPTCRRKLAMKDIIRVYLPAAS